VFIDTNGYILPCYRAFEGLSMGKVYDEDGVDFSEIWNSPDYRQLRATVNNDGAEKFYKYCGRCEFRYGWGDLAPHLGDETWVEALSEQKNGELVQINHRRK
jgi:radical SAM protein with 4Fe4S-binding SPASM domain